MKFIFHILLFYLLYYIFIMFLINTLRVSNLSERNIHSFNICMNVFNTVGNVEHSLPDHCGRLEECMCYIHPCIYSAEFHTDTK